MTEMFDPPTEAATKLADALYDAEAGSHYAEPDGDYVVVDGTYKASALLRTLMAVAWDEGWYAHEMWDGSDAERANPYRAGADQ